MEAERERTASAGVQRVVDTVAGQSETQHNGVGHTVVHIVEVLPVLEAVPLIADVGCEGEVVIRPLQALAEAHRDSCHLQELVGVVGVLVVVVAIVITTIIVHIVIIHVVILHVVGVLAVVVRRVDARLAAVEARHRQRVGALASKPRVEERDAIGLVIFGVGLGTDGERLAVALRD